MSRKQFVRGRCCFHRSLVALLLTWFFQVDPSVGKDCETIEGNQVPSCGLESPAEVADWTYSGGTLDFAAGLGETGNGAVGTAEDFEGLWVFSRKSPCFPAFVGQEFDLGFWVKLLSGSVPDGCSAGWQQYSDAACSVPSGGAVGRDKFVPGDSYIEVIGSHLVGAGTLALSLIIDCRGAGGFEVLVDNGYARVSIFADDFESGNTSAWSSSQP